MSTNTIRLTAKQRAALHVEPGDVVVFTDGFGTVRHAKVKRALRHQIASGTHNKTHAPCEVHDGPSPRPARVKASSIERRRVAADAPALADDDGVNMTEGEHAALIENRDAWQAQALTTHGRRFSFAFDLLPDGETGPIAAQRSRAAYEVLVNAPRVADVERVFVDETQMWHVNGSVMGEQESELP